MKHIYLVILFFSLNSFSQENLNIIKDFDIDYSITGLKFYKNINNVIILNKNGIKPQNEKLETNIKLLTIPRIYGYEHFKNEVYDLLKFHQSSGYSLSRTKLKPQVINGYESIVIDAKIEYKSMRGIIYIAVLAEHSTVVFIGTAFNDIKNYRNKFIETVKTIKINK
jgi:hypothetical protein